MKKLLVGVALATLAFGCGDDGDGAVVPSPTADFDWSPSNPEPLEATDFTDQSSPGSGTITNWDWTFTDGTPATSTDQNPTGVTFSSAGFKNVTLTVTTNNSLTSTVVKLVPIKDVTDLNSPMLDVTEVKLRGTATDNVAVTSLTDDKGGLVIEDGTADEPSENFGTSTITLGSGPGDSSVSITISADDAAGSGPTNVTVTIDEDLQ